MSKVTQTWDLNPGCLPSELTPLTTKQGCPVHHGFLTSKDLLEFCPHSLEREWYWATGPAKKEAKKELERRVWLSLSWSFAQGPVRRRRVLAGGSRLVSALRGN